MCASLFSSSVGVFFNVSEKLSNALFTESQAGSSGSSLTGLSPISALTLFPPSSWRCWELGQVSGCSCLPRCGRLQRLNSAWLVREPVPVALLWRGKPAKWPCWFSACGWAWELFGGETGQDPVSLQVESRAPYVLTASVLNERSCHHFQCQVSEFGKGQLHLRSCEDLLLICAHLRTPKAVQAMGCFCCVASRVPLSLFR